MSGRLIERPQRLRRISTSSPWAFSAATFFFFCPRHVFRCLFISEAKIFCLQAWHCWRISLFLGSEMILSSMVLGCGACCCIFCSNSPPDKVRFWSYSKLMVSTNQKSFQSMLISLACLACCSFLPLACCCFVLWYSKTVLQRLRMASLSLRYNARRSISSLLISRMLVYPLTNLLKYSLFLELGRRNQKWGLFFSRSLRATKKFLPFFAAYWAVCWMMACSPSDSFYGSSAMYFGGSGSLSSVKICSRKMFCFGPSSSVTFADTSASMIWILASSSCGDSGGICSSFMPCSSFLLTSAT